MLHTQAGETRHLLVRTASATEVACAFYMVMGINRFAMPPAA
jgi:hypothetical protein